jgi:hypothetical protein
MVFVCVSSLQGTAYALLDKKEEADEQFDVYRSLVPV